MTKLFRYFKGSVGTLVLIVALLVVQAYCDLSLPSYTASIVDVGIQQGGIADAAPQWIRGETLEDLKLFMSSEQAALAEGAYTEGDGGVYTRKSLKKAELEELNSAMGLPMLALSSMEESGQMDMDTFRAMVKSGQISSEQIQAIEEETVVKMGDQSDTIINQKSVLFVKAEYTAMGLDLDQIQMDYLWATGAKMLGLSLVMVVAAILSGLLSARTAAKIGMSLRGDVFKKVVSFSNAELDKFSTASLITRSTNDIQQVQTVIVMLLRIVAYAPIVGIFAIFKVMATNTGMTWIIGVAVGLILLLVSSLMIIALPRFKKMQQLVDRLNLVSREILTGLSVIRAFSREKHEERRFDDASSDLMKTQLFTNRVMSTMMPAMMLIMNGITLLITWNGAHGIDLGRLQVGDMIAFISYTMQIVIAFFMISMVSIMLPRAAVSAGRINEVLETPLTVADPTVTRDGELEHCAGVVAFEDVSFRYPDAEADVLEHVSFIARPGETTAIIGSTGSGKSTLLNLIPRFFDVTGGRITVDGVDIRELSQHRLRAILGYVAQKGVLFSGTIESNLKFGGEITDAQMEEAALIAQATDFVESKPEGYRDPIAQGGSNVSGGQKQRLSIARAIAKGPKVLLFDDAFSALDYKTDAALRRALAEQVGGATVIIVAQRISTILNADQIIVLDEGQVMGMGTHRELMSTCKTYQEIARSQLSEAELGGEGA